MAVGYGNNSQQNFFAVARYQADGELNPTFGAGGKFITPVGSNDQANAVFVQPDGKVVAGGSSYGSFALVRYATNGVPDPSFGTGGIAKALVGNSGEIKALQLQPDGKIVAAGARPTPTPLTPILPLPVSTRTARWILPSAAAAKSSPASSRPASTAPTLSDCSRMANVFWL